jgi:hypothetical protein
MHQKYGLLFFALPCLLAIIIPKNGFGNHLCCGQILVLNDEKGNQSAEVKPSITVIVRIPTFANKINYLQAQTQLPDLSPKVKKKQMDALTKTKQDRDAYFSTLYTGFINYFHACEVLFMPDSLYKRYLNGDRNVFISPTGQLFDKAITTDSVFYIIQSNNIHQLLLTNKSGQKLSKPWPYKKNTFLPAFKQLWQQKEFIFDQIRWFDKKISTILTNVKP